MERLLGGSPHLELEQWPVHFECQHWGVCSLGAVGLGCLISKYNFSAVSLVRYLAKNRLYPVRPGRNSERLYRSMQPPKDSVILIRVKIVSIIFRIVLQ